MLFPSWDIVFSLLENCDCAWFGAAVKTEAASDTSVAGINCKTITLGV